MRWFKHDCDMHTDLKIQAHLSEHGLEGYAIFNLCLELVGKEGSRGKLMSKTMWQDGLLKVFARSDDGMGKVKLNKILMYLAQIDLISSKSFKYGHLHIPNFTKRIDDYTARQIRTMSEPDTDKVLPDIDKNRTEQNPRPLLLFFCDKYKQKQNKDYVINWAKDQKILKDLLAILSEAEIKSRIDQFFEMKSDFVVGAGYTVGVFKSQINKLGQVRTDGVWSSPIK